MNKLDCSLYLVTDRKAVGDKDFYKSVEEALEGGVSIIQLREKNISTLEFYKVAMDVKVIVNKYNVPLIINDRIDIAQAIDADGVHLGQEDLPLGLARKILGPDKIIGISARTIEDAKRAEKEGADYLGVGAMFTTNTKDNTVRITVDRLKEIKSSVNIPLVAIGGINQSNINELKDGKMDGVAVVSAILSHAKPREAAENLLKSIREFKSK